MLTKFLVFGYFLLTLTCIRSENILFVAVNFENSHRHIFVPVIAKLLSNGHNVTAVVTHSLFIKADNYHQIHVNIGKHSGVLPRTNHLSIGSCNHSKRFVGCLFTYLKELTNLWEAGREATKKVFNSTKFQEFYSDENLKFDLVISELNAQEVMYQLSYFYQVPLVLFSTSDYSQPHIEAIGAFSIWSHVPNLFKLHDDDKGLFSRFFNRLFSLIYVKFRRIFHLPQVDKISRESFVNFNRYRDDVPDVPLLEKTAVLYLFNSLQFLHLNKPKMEGIVDIAGVHIRRKKDLEPDIKTFLDNAYKGSIFFDLDGIMKQLLWQPDINFFISIFKRAKCKIIMKYHDESLKVPNFMMVRKRVNQNDVLAHPNVKLFITHGNIMGIQEAAYHKVPMIIVPLHGDQFENARKVKEAGVGLLLPFEHFSTHVFLEYIHKMMFDPQYQKKIEKVSEIFKSDYQPIENAVYSIEHVMKFKEEFLFKPPVSEAPFYEYLFLDFICMFFLGGRLVLNILRWFYEKCCCCCKRKRKIEPEDEKTEKGKGDKKNQVKPSVQKPQENTKESESKLKVNEEKFEDSNEEKVKNAEDLELIDKENKDETTDPKTEVPSEGQDQKTNKSNENSSSENQGANKKQNSSIQKEKDVTKPKFEPKNKEIELMNKAKIN